MRSPLPSTIFAACAVLALASATSHAAITVNNVDFATTNSTGGNGDFTSTGSEGAGTKVLSYSYSAGASADMLVVTVSNERSSEAPLTVTYNGVAMTFAVGNSVGSGAAIYYLANPFSGGAAALSFDFAGIFTENGLGISVASLNGNGEDIILSETSVVSPDNNSTTTSIDLTTTATDSFVIAGFDGNGNLGSGSVGAPLTQIYYNADFGSNGGGAGYETGVGPGLNTYEWTVGNTTGSTGPRRIVAASFTTIPEPSAALLGSFSLLTLLRRRRS